MRSFAVWQQQSTRWQACDFVLASALLQLAIVIAVNSIRSDWFVLLLCGNVVAEVCMCVRHVYPKTESFSSYTKTTTCAFSYLLHLVCHPVKSHPIENLSTHQLTNQSPKNPLNSVKYTHFKMDFVRVIHISFKSIKICTDFVFHMRMHIQK